MVSFTGLSPKQAQSIEVLKNHISLPDVEVGVSQSDQASISIKGEGGNYQLTYRKPHQLYRALSVLATALVEGDKVEICLLYTSPSPRDSTSSRMPSSA